MSPRPLCRGRLLCHPKTLSSTGVINTVTTPATPIERLLMAPWTSPISIAFVVPSAWLAVPMATPCATGFLMRKNLQTSGAVTAPVIPVMTIETIVMDGMPPICSDTTEPIGMVIDFGMRESMSVLLIPKIFAQAITQTMLTVLPTTIPARIGSHAFFRA